MIISEMQRKLVTWIESDPPETGKANTWLVYKPGERGNPVGEALRRLVSSPEAQFRWRTRRSIDTSSGLRLITPSPHAITMYGHGPGLNGESYVLKGSVRFGEEKRYCPSPSLKVKGDWLYLYQAVDSNDNTVEFLFSRKRDLISAKRFLRKALARHGKPERTTIDCSQTNRMAIMQCDAENPLRQAGGPSRSGPANT